MQKTLREPYHLSFVFKGRGDSERHGRPLPGTCFGDAARYYLSIPNKPFRRTSVVLCLRNTFHGRSRYSLTSAPIYQATCCPESGFDRLFDVALQICGTNSNKDVDLVTLSFVSHLESERVFTRLLTWAISSFSSQQSFLDDCVSLKEQVSINGTYRCITSSESIM